MPVGGGHVRRDRAVVSFEARADVACYAGPLVEEFYHPGTDTHLELLLDERLGHRIGVACNFHVIVNVDAGAFPLSIFIGLGREGLQGGAVEGLSACLKRSRSRCETPHHQVDHGDSDPRLRGLRQGLQVFTEPPRAIEPAKRAFDHPTPLHHLKALGVPGALHHHEGALQDRRHPRDELAGVPPIGPDQCQSRQAGDECPEHLFGPITVLDPRRMHDDNQEQPEDIDDDVALAPADALAAVIAPGPPFSVVFTVWLSMIPALGFCVRPETSRRSPRGVSCIRSQTPARRQVRK